MSAVDHKEIEKSSGPCCSANQRPQRLYSWFNLIPVKEFEKNLPETILFLDSFVTVTEKPASNGLEEKGYTVLWQGKDEMTVVVKYDVIFVWYGENLLEPDRPFPVIFEKPFTSQYISSKPSRFEKTHVMDFVENGSDNLHFKVVHLWEQSKQYDHQITEDKITLQQDIKMNYGASTTDPLGRFIARLLPQLNLHHFYVYHGPGLATVSATGIKNLEFHSLVSLTPEGENGTRLYVTIAVNPDTWPKWLEKLFSLVSPKKMICDIQAAIMASFVQNEFHMDAVIWANKRYQNLNLLPSEKVLNDVRKWGETFYPKDFIRPEPVKKPEEEKDWAYLDDVKNIRSDEVNTYTVSGEELIAYKDSQGEVHVFEAYCSHQGAHLGYGGKLEHGCIRCPFHGFYFDGEGRCIGQNTKNRDKFIKDINLKVITQRVDGDIVEVFV